MKTSKLLIYGKTLINGAGCREYSMWRPYYQDPIFRKEQQEEMEKMGEKERLASVPFKAARTEETCSVFYDAEIHKFILYVMRKGQKDLARQLVEDTFKNIKKIQLKKYYNAETEESKAEIELDPRKIFHTAIANCKPVLELTSVKRGGATYQVPVPVRDKRARFLSMNWLIRTSKDTPKGTMFHDTLAVELIDAANNTGKVIKKKIDLHRQCEANRAYAHYRWG